MTKTTLALLLACLSVSAQERGNPIFDDSFDTSATFAEHWIPIPRHVAFTNKDGRLSVPVGGSLQMRRDTPADFLVSVDAAFPDDKVNKDGNSRAGFLIEGLSFTISPTGRIFAWRGEAIEGYEAGKPVNLELSRRCAANFAEYVFKVNGREVRRDIKPLPVAGSDGKLKPLNIFVWGQTIDVDGFRLCSLKRSADESPNMVINSSFEHAQDGFPLYFGRSSRMNYTKAVSMDYPYYEVYIATWSLDKAEKHGGVQSLKLVNDGLATGQYLWASGAKTIKDMSGVFSVWMKADRKGVPVSISYGVGKKVDVGTEWERYEVVNPKLPAPGVYSPVVISFSEPGTLWLDDLQAEFLPPVDEAALTAGKTFATPYRPSALDEPRFAGKGGGKRTGIPAVPKGPGESRTVGSPVAPGRQAEISMLGRLNYYMNEPEAVFKVGSTLADAGRMTARLECAGINVEAPADTEFKISLPLKDIPNGIHPAVLTMLKDGTNVATATSVLVKRPYKEGATQINHFSRSLLHDGKPVFPFAPFAGDTSFLRFFTRDYARWKLDLYQRYGFRYTHVLMVPQARDGGGGEFMDLANRKGFLLTLWTKHDVFKADEEGIRRAFEGLDYPNILSQMVMDEPEVGGIPSDTARDFLRKVRPMFPYQPVQMNNTIIGIPAGYAHLETDILMLDDYLTNMENRPVDSVVRGADEMWKAGAAEGKPCFYFLVGGNFPLHYKEPSYGEQISQTYGVIAAGCTGLSYFYGEPLTPGNWKAMVQLNKEILALRGALLSEEETPEAQCDGNPDMLRFRTKKHQGYLYVVACDIDANPVGKTTFTLPAEFGYARRAEVMFEGRDVAVRRGKFSDKFPGLSRHVYKIGLSSGE